MAGGAGTFRDDSAHLVINEAMAEHLADRMAARFHSIAHKQIGGSGQFNPESGNLSAPNPQTANQWGGKAIIKFNPTSDEILSGIRQSATLLVWQSPDGLPHYVTIDVGRLSGGVGGSNGEDTLVSLGAVSTTGVGGGTFPLGQDAAGNMYSYRASAQVVIGTPGTMQDPFFIDINRGQRFTALASYVAITAQMNAPPTTSLFPPFGTGLPYVAGSMGVYATLGAAVAPTLAPVLFTQYADPIAPAFVNVAFNKIVPPRANVLSAIMLGPVLANPTTVTVGFRDPVGSTLSNMQFNAAAFPPPSATIPEDCYSLLITFTNGDVLGNHNWRLIYQLSV